MEEIIERSETNQRRTKRKLKKIYEINKKEGESIGEFKRRFFKEGNEADFLMLMCKPICEDCQKSHKNLKEFMPFSPEMEEEIEDTYDAMSTVFQYYKEEPICEYCGERRISGFVFHVVDFTTVNEILNKYLSDWGINALSNLRKVYDELSNHFVHFSFVADIVKPWVFRINTDSIVLGGLDGICYVLENLSMILCDLFVLIKNKYDVEGDIPYCKPRKRKFSNFQL